MNITEEIILARLMKGLSQESVANLLYISKNDYKDIEENKSKLSANRLLKIAQILEIDLGEILMDNAKKVENVGEINRLKAELLLANIESIRWKERFMRSVFIEKLKSNRCI